MTCGIYKLSFTNSVLVYIGQSENIEYRFTQHLYKLRNNTSSKKLQEAYHSYGTPLLEILVECSLQELDSFENEAIDVFNSVSNGLNTYDSARGKAGGIGLQGELNPLSKYTNKHIKEVLVYLVTYPDLTATDIAAKLDVGVSTVRAISALNEHTWLEKEMPTEYLKLRSLKGLANKSYKFSSAARGISYPDLKSPLGVVYTNIPNVKQFCREHSLQDTNLLLVLKGIRKSHKGWKLCQEEQVL
jgi:hypothetical protein